MSEYLKRSARIAAMVLAGLTLAGCGGSFATSYQESAPAAARSNWKAAKVEVIVPKTLSTTEQNSYIPHADLVWHGDRYGDRHAQVAEIVKAGIASGAAGLKGPETVVFTATVRRFHSLSPKAYYAAPAGTGVHTVTFDLVVTDARTGAILAGPERIEADMPARVAAEGGGSGSALPGDEWKAVIQSHIAATVRGWLGTGPDVRTRFTRMGA